MPKTSKTSPGPPRTLMFCDRTMAVAAGVGVIVAARAVGETAAVAVIVPVGSDVGGVVDVATKRGE